MRIEIGKNLSKLLIISIIWICLCLIFVCDLHADNFFTGKQGTGAAWNSTYILLGYMGTSVLDLTYQKLNIKYPLIKAFLSIIIIAFTKECFDEMYKLTGLKEHSFFDKRGFDINDISRAGFGGAGYITIRIAL